MARKSCVLSVSNLPTTRDLSPLAGPAKKCKKAPPPLGSGQVLDCAGIKQRRSTNDHSVGCGWSDYMAAEPKS